MNVTMDSQSEFTVNQTFEKDVCEKVVFNTVVLERIQFAKDNK